MNACEWPDQVWLGMTRGEWTVVVFVREDMAAKWAVDFDGAERYIRGPVPIPTGVVEMSPVYVPASYTLEPRVSTQPIVQDHTNGSQA